MKEKKPKRMKDRLEMEEAKKEEEDNRPLEERVREARRLAVEE